MCRNCLQQSEVCLAQFTRHLNANDTVLPVSQPEVVTNII